MKKIIISVFALFGLTVAQAQSQAPSLAFGGLVYNHDVVTSTDLAAMSQPHIFGTARVMGMGGAFVSLGADLSSMSINPAGMGMYQHNEFSITPLLTMGNGSTPGTQTWTHDGKTHFGLSNVGIALQLYQSGSTALSGLTFGIGMNRIADFNTRYSYSSEYRYDPASGNLMPTIADVFGQQLGQDGVLPDQGGYLNTEDVDPWYWPAVMGYNGYMISPDADGNWTPDCIGHNASVLSSVEVENRGAINEIPISLGFNFRNKVYFGFTLGLQNIVRETNVTYQEEYGYFDNPQGVATDADGNMLESQLDYANLYQHTRMSGVGFNIKLGLIWAPVKGLKLGVAFHTPTWYSLNFTNDKGDIQSELYNNITGDYLQPDYASSGQYDDREDGNNWNFQSPTRLMFGASYTFGQIAVLSVDYERDWYNGIRLTHTPYGLDYMQADYKDEFKGQFQATNAIRAGLEIKPLPMLAVRVGGGYTSSMLKNPQYYFDAPSAMSSWYVSAGLGVWLSRSISLDASYQYIAQKQTPYELYYSMDTQTGEMPTYSGLYDTKLSRHFVSLTATFRF